MLSREIHLHANWRILRLHHQLNYLINTIAKHHQLLNEKAQVFADWLDDIKQKILKGLNSFCLGGSCWVKPMSNNLLVTYKEMDKKRIVLYCSNELFWNLSPSVLWLVSLQVTVYLISILIPWCGSFDLLFLSWHLLVGAFPLVAEDFWSNKKFPNPFSGR